MMSMCKYSFVRDVKHRLRSIYSTTVTVIVLHQYVYYTLYIIHCTSIQYNHNNHDNHEQNRRGSKITTKYPQISTVPSCTFLSGKNKNTCSKKIKQDTRKFEPTGAGSILSTQPQHDNSIQTPTHKWSSHPALRWKCAIAPVIQTRQRA